MKAIIVITKNGAVNVHKFNTIANAYYFYLCKYSTFGEWWYYLRCAHRLLNRVENERVMQSIFYNVFAENVTLVIDNNES